MVSPSPRCDARRAISPGPRCRGRASRGAPGDRARRISWSRRCGRIFALRSATREPCRRRTAVAQRRRSAKNMAMVMLRRGRLMSRSLRSLSTTELESRAQRCSRCERVTPPRRRDIVDADRCGCGWVSAPYTVEAGCFRAFKILGILSAAARFNPERVDQGHVQGRAVPGSCPLMIAMGRIVNVVLPPIQRSPSAVLEQTYALTLGGWPPGHCPVFAWLVRSPPADTGEAGRRRTLLISRRWDISISAPGFGPLPGGSFRRSPGGRRCRSRTIGVADRRPRVGDSTGRRM